MLEQAYDTILGIIFNDLPKKEVSPGKFLPTIYDKPVVGWYFGDRTIIPNTDTPAISIFGTNVTPTFKAFRTRQQEYKFTISCYAQSNDKENSVRSILEFTRLVNEVLRKHRFIWVCSLCPFTDAQILSPEYFLNQPDINAVLQPYIAEASIGLQDLWNVTNNNLPLPVTPSAVLAYHAYTLFWRDVQRANQVNGSWENIPSGDMVKIALNTLPDNYSPEQVFNNIVNMQLFLRKPIRLFFDVFASDIKPTDKGENKALLYGSTFEIQAKELYKEIEFGPNNVSILSAAPK